MAFYEHRQPSPLSAPDYPPLAKQISSATWGFHDSLSSQIEKGLPLALPPKADDPKFYAQGLARFGMIYLTFEQAWAKFLGEDDAEDLYGSSGKTHATYDTDSAKHLHNLKRFFQDLRPEGLARTKRLNADLTYLGVEGSLDQGKVNTNTSTKGKGTVRDEFREHIQRRIDEEPATIYAYAWCMYMAIFAGGRIIREDLRDAGLDFWQRGHQDEDEDAGDLQMSLLEALRMEVTNERAPRDQPGYSFLSFSGADDGEPLKDAFLRNLYAAEELFTPAERDAVVTESLAIFRWTIRLVDEMYDDIKPPSAAFSGRRLASPPPHLPPSPPPYRASEKAIVSEKQGIATVFSSAAAVPSSKEGPYRLHHDTAASTQARLRRAYILALVSTVAYCILLLGLFGATGVHGGAGMAASHSQAPNEVDPLPGLGVWGFWGCRQRKSPA